jgi:hypothetical protein
VLSRLPVRLPVRARGLQRPAVHRVPARLHGPGGNADLVDDERFTGEYLQALESLNARGARATLEAWERG